MQPAPKKLLFLTGTRADFGKMKPLIQRMQASPGFDSVIFVTGMHMLARYGYTVEEVRKAGLKNIFTYINQIEIATTQMDLVLANTIQGLGFYIREFLPDLIVVHGDRVEALAGAIVGALNNIRVAHVEGGELSGTVDELIRHSVSKLAHLHFVANEEARDRLIQMGEFPETVFVVGSPDIDVMLSDQLPSLEEVRRHYEIPFEDYCILIYHPVTTELHSIRSRAAAVVQAMRSSGLRYVVIYPNNDAGSEIILEELLTLKNDPAFRLLPSLRFESFLTLLRHAKAIVGNSSAGIREAPVYGVPTINVGTRQANRFCHQSIINVPEDAAAIMDALRRIPERFPASLHFGQGRSAELFMNTLQDQAVWQTTCQKHFRDLTLDPLRTGLSAASGTARG